MANWNPRNNGGTAHLFGTTPKLPRLGEPTAAERPGVAQPAKPAQPVQVPQTFAQMQAAGQARPAPQQVQPVAAPMAASMDPVQPVGTAPAAPQAPRWEDFQRQYSNPLGAASAYSAAVDAWKKAQAAQTTQNNPILNQLAQTLSGMGSTPTRFDTDLYQRLRDQALGDLDADFGARRQDLDTMLARRGLWSSSGELGAGARYGDLEGQYARARGGIETDLLRSAAETQWQDRMARDQMFMSLAQMLAGMKPKDMQKFLTQLNLQAAQNQQEG